MSLTPPLSFYPDWQVTEAEYYQACKGCFPLFLPYGPQPGHVSIKKFKALKQYCEGKPCKIDLAEQALCAIRSRAP